jgi:hypothetical protein
MMALALALAAAFTASTPDDNADDAVRARALIDDMRLDEALAVLDGVPKPRSLDAEVRVLELRGIALAYAERVEEASRVFERLLVLAPAHALPYTLTPKATFPFQSARQRLESLPATHLRLEAPLVGAWDEALPVRVTRGGDPLDVMRRLRVCVGARGAAPACEEHPAPSVGASLTLTLRAFPVPTGADATATTVAVLTVEALDEDGTVVQREPTGPRGLEIPIGFAPPEPWYASAWLWGGLAGVAAAVATGAGIGAAVALRPTAAVVSAEVLP